MDSVSAPAPALGQDEWDADGFEIPSLKIGKSAPGKKEPNGVNDPFKTSFQKVMCGTEKIYLGPHGAPPSQLKQQEVTACGRKQRLKQQLNEAEKKGTSLGRDNIAGILRDLK